ncbi:hypothetical protein CPC08DRAFT_768172 [Agrocybe pediades]|nr:hypothetical protein CPC08DRAFT_768172 [Agrocybe pediades]
MLQTFETLFNMQFFHSTAMWEFRGDTDLRLSHLWIHATLDTLQEDSFSINTYSDGINYLAYFDYMHRLLRSVSAPSPTVYAKAAKECFDTLPLLVVPSFFWKHNTRVADDTEDDLCPNLVFNDKYFVGPWLFVENDDPSWSNSESSNGNMGIMESYEDEQSGTDDDGLRDHECKSLVKAYFTILGYLIFFLPRCGRSDELIAACKRQQTLCIEKPNNPFPIRWRRLHQEIDSYLARVLPISDV